MKTITRCLISACLIFADYVSTGVVYADASSMKALADDALEKTRECRLVSQNSINAGQKNRLANECSGACNAAHSLLSRQGNFKPAQQKQKTREKLAQMERCKQAYSDFKSPETAPVEEEDAMPTTVEEMATRMSTMKTGKRANREYCAPGVTAIRHRKIDLKQAKRFWDGCLRGHKQYMQQNRMYGEP